jgi:uncharacterized protein
MPNGRWLATSFLVLLLAAGSPCLDHAEAEQTDKPQHYEEYLGNYTLDDGAVIAVAKFDLGEGADRLMFTNFLSGRTGLLSAVAPDTFTSGPGLLVDSPAEIRITFIRDASGKASGLRYGHVGSKDVSARKLRDHKQEDVSFNSGEVALSGTLTLPAIGGAHPAIVLLHGSDAGRRETLGPLPYFFARLGIAVLTYDKRGDGKSSGDWRKSSFEALSDDAAAAVRFLRTRSDIDPKRIGFMGNSEGGWVALRATAQTKDFAFLILRAGPAVSPWQQDLMRVEPILRADGFKEVEVAEAVSLAKLKQQFARTGTGWEAYQAAAQKARSKPWYSFAGGPLAKDNWWWQWYRTKMDYDPAPDLARIRCPILAFFGDLDFFVLAEQNRKAMEQALRKSGNRHYTIITVPRGNHAFLEANTGSPGEIPRLNRFVPMFFETMSTWLTDRVIAKR